MTITEALIAIVIAAGVMIAAVEAARSAAARTALALLEMEAVSRAETLLATAGADFPLVQRRFQGAQAEGVTWSVVIEQRDSTTRKPTAFRVTSSVAIARGGITVQQSLSTLKLSWGVSR